MAFNIFATATSDIPLANLDANFTLIGAAAAASTLYPTASTSITYGTAGTTHNFSGSGLAVTGTLSNTTGATFATSSGNVGIGTTSPSSVLNVKSSAPVFRLETTGTVSSTGTAQYSIRDSTGADVFNCGYLGLANCFQFGTIPAAGFMRFLTGAQVEAMRIDSSGNVGIATNSPAALLDINGSAGWAGGTTGNVANIKGANATVSQGGNLRVLSSTAFGIDLGGSMALGGQYTSGFYLDFAQIAGRKENATDGSAAGYLAFATRGTGNTTERMRIDSSGNVGIGVTPSYQLQVNTDSAGKPGVGGLWTVVSDKRIKSDIVPANLDRCYEIVKSVPLKHFGFAPGVYTDDQIQDKHNLGWIAQDVQKVFKNAVSVKPFTLKTDIPDGVEEYEEQDFTLESVEKTEISIQVINGKAVQVSKVVQSENKVMLFDTVDVLDEAGAVVMDGDKPLAYQMPRMITKTRPKVRHDVIEDCLDLNSGQMIAALYGCVQALMAKVEALEAKA